MRGDAIAEAAIDAAESGDLDLVTVYTDVYDMRIQLEKMRKPIGTRDSPARSCKDLHHGHPQLKDGNDAFCYFIITKIYIMTDRIRKILHPFSTCPGYYWIDPNLGMSDDAVKVHCDMEQGGETCVFPDVHASKMPNIPWRKSGNGWYSSLRGGFKVCLNCINVNF